MSKEERQERAARIYFRIWHKEIWPRLQEFGRAEHRVWWTYVSFLNKDQTPPFLGISKVAEHSGLMPITAKCARENLIEVGVLVKKGEIVSGRGNQLLELLPWGATTQGYHWKGLDEKEYVTMHVCKMRDDGTIKKLNPVITFLLSHVVGVVDGKGGMLDLGLNAEDKERSFEQFLLDEYSGVVNFNQARRVRRWLRDNGFLHCEIRNKGWGRGRDPSMFYLALPFVENCEFDDD